MYTTCYVKNFIIMFEKFLVAKVSIGGGLEPQIVTNTPDRRYRQLRQSMTLRVMLGLITIIV